MRHLVGQSSRIRVHVKMFLAVEDHQSSFRALGEFSVVSQLAGNFFFGVHYRYQD